MNIRSLSKSSRDFLLSNVSMLKLKQKSFNPRWRNQNSPCIKRIWNVTTRNFGYWTYHFVNCFTMYENTVSNNISKQEKKVSSRMKCISSTRKAFLDYRIIGTFKLACNMNDTHNGDIISVLLHFIRKILTRALKICMFAEGCISPFAAFIRHKKPSSHQLLRTSQRWWNTY